MVFHKDLTGANLHEPKGIDSASDGQVYIADGAGSGVWTTQTFPSGNFLISNAYFTSSGTWTKPNNLICVEIVCIGSGGSGAPTAGVNGSSANASSFGAYCVAGGGGGATNFGGTRGIAGVAGTSDFSMPGKAGDNSGPGGLTYFGFGDYGQGGVGVGGAGGGAGAYAIRYRTASQLTDTVAVTVSGGTANGLVYVKQYIEA